MPEAVEEKTREQLEAEKQAVLAQRIAPLELSGLDAAGLLEKVKEIHDRVYKLESDKYDTEERYKKQQVEISELQERARQMSKGGKKRSGVDDQVHPPCPFDRLADKYTNAPPKIELASKYERNLDRRSFADKMKLFLKPANGTANGENDGEKENEEEED